MFRKSLKFSILALLAATSLTACGLFHHTDTPEDKGFFYFGDNGKREAELAVVAYTQGHFDEADDHIREALHDNKKNEIAMLVGALVSEKTNRPNRARQFYEDILLYNGNELSVLGATTPEPQKITEIARKRLRQLNLSQNKLIIEDSAGNKVFNISNEASVKNGTKAMEEALFIRQKHIGQKSAAEAKADRNAIDVLFDDGEKNTISRFIILKELAENDLITKDEFLRARQANIGGLLPLTKNPPSSQVVKPVPTAGIIIDRINALKSAVEDRAISAKEFSAERNLIIEAVLPPHPSQRLKKKAPAKDIINAAKDLRKLEVIYDLNLITSDEKEQEKKAIEQSLGLNPETTNNEPKTLLEQYVQPQPVQPQAQLQDQPQPIIVKEVIKVVEPETETPTTKAKNTITATKPTETPQPLVPDVSSPFNK